MFMAELQTQSNGIATVKQSPKKARKLSTLPSAATDGAIVGNYQFRLAETFWTDLPKGAIFSMNKDGSFPFFKLSKSSYQDLRTLEVATNVQGNSKVFRVFI
jgi:hypothetical protein